MPSRCDRTPSRGRGPNAAFADRLRASETDRGKWYPAPGAYLRAIQNARQHLAAGGTVKTWWGGDGLDAAAFERELGDALNRRISAKGGISYSRHNDPHTKGLDVAFVRDRDALERFRRDRVRLHPFSTRTMRERFGHLVAR